MVSEHHYPRRIFIGVSPARDAATDPSLVVSSLMLAGGSMIRVTRSTLPHFRTSPCRDSVVASASLDLGGLDFCGKSSVYERALNRCELLARVIECFV